MVYGLINPQFFIFSDLHVTCDVLANLFHCARGSLRTWDRPSSAEWDNHFFGFSHYYSSIQRCSLLRRQW
jgi:hypothetical protein